LRTQPRWPAALRVATCSESIGRTCAASAAIENERPARDEHLLVRERDVAAGAQRGNDGLETRAAHQRPDHQIRIVRRD
jgi:hypothetical protein